MSYLKQNTKRLMKLLQVGQREMDLEIQISQFELAYHKYDELLE